MTISQYAPEQPEPLPEFEESSPTEPVEELSSILDEETDTEDELSSVLELLSEHPADKELSFFPQILGIGKECPHSPLVKEQA